MTNNRKILLLPGIALGVMILVAAIILKPSPDLQKNLDNARVVEVMSLVKQNAAPQVTGFGLVSPKHSWQAIAEVNGKIIYRHPQLETGRLIRKGTMVLAVDPLEYQLKQAQAEANLNSAKAKLSRLEQEQENLKISLDIERQKSTLVKQEYLRKQALNKKKLISNSELETQKQALLAQRNLLQNLASSLNLIPDDKKVTEAQIKVNQAQLKDAKRQLENTRFRLPFDARIADVNIEQAQAVKNGEVLFTAQQLDRMEIKVELSLQDVDTLRRSVLLFPKSNTLPAAEKLNFTTRIDLKVGDKTLSWPARLTRIGDNVDAQQATLGVYLEATQDFASLDLRIKPPLSKGMFVRAEIQGIASPHFIVPEKALHAGNVYIMDEQHKLQIKAVQIEFRNVQGVAISGNLKEGEQFILNDIIPAIPGMQLKLAPLKKNAEENLQ